MKNYFTGFKFSLVWFLKILPLIILASITNLQSSNAQLAILDMNAYVISTNNESSAFCTVFISDTLDCNSITVELSEIINDSIVLSKDFEFDKVIGLLPGLTWSRYENRIDLSLGIVPNNPVWKIKIILKNGQDLVTATEEIIFN